MNIVGSLQNTSSTTYVFKEDLDAFRIEIKKIVVDMIKKNESKPVLEKKINYVPLTKKIGDFFSKIKNIFFILFPSFKQKIS